MGNFLGTLIILILIVLIFVYVVLPIIGLLLGIGVVIMTSIAGVGVVFGLYTGLKNFIVVFKEAHERLGPKKGS